MSAKDKHYISRYIGILEEDTCGFAPSERAVETKTTQTQAHNSLDGMTPSAQLAAVGHLRPTRFLYMNKAPGKVRQKAEDLINTFPKTR